ncbi:MAG: hypothetical protein SFX72_10600 [Isosphaeraceae bacterium]|nr:hypothetical protein [Isosphaeraceae bacterium]
MPNTTVQCPHCGVVLAVPEGAAGRRLKCPHCSQIFRAEIAAAASPPAAPVRPPVMETRRPPSTAPGVPPKKPAPAAPPAAPPLFVDDIEVPRGDGPLRDILDLPLLDDGPPKNSTRPENDALALFSDDAPPKKKVLAGDARKQMRRCPTCSTPVPAGMSLCSTCGLDLETGRRIGLEEDLVPVSSGPRRQGMPLEVLGVGGLTLIASIILAVMALVGTQNGTTGAEFLLVVCLFGIFASVQFLRVKSVKLLIVALTLGVMVDVIALIAIPVYTAVTDVEFTQVGNVSPDDELEVDHGIRPITEKLDMNRVTWGIALVFAYAAISVYLNSPPIRKHFERR